MDALAESSAGLNPYHFGNNNPVSFSDPSGARALMLNQDGTDVQGPNIFWGLTHSREIRDGLGMDDFGDPFVSAFHGGGFYGGGGGGGSYSAFWNNLWVNAPGGQNTTYSHNPIGYDPSRPYGYTNTSASGSFNTNVYHGDTYNDPDVNYETYFLTSFQGLGLNSPSSGVGQPGALESAIPVWGNSRAAVDDFQNGNWGWGVFHTAMAVGDVFLIKSAVTGIGKLAAAGISRFAAKEGTQTVYRVFGDEASALGRSWTPIDPRTILNYRFEAGLPIENTGRFLIEGTINVSDIISIKNADAIGENLGGLTEYILNGSKVNINNVLGLNPHF